MINIGILFVCTERDINPNKKEKDKITRRPLEPSLMMILQTTNLTWTLHRKKRG